MTSADESERRSSHPAPPCAGLDPTSRWDVASSLRGELFSVDRLVEHAAELARSQGAVIVQRTRGPLYERLGEVRTRIRDAYAVLGRDIREGREPSPAEEWLVDNAHRHDRRAERYGQDAGRRLERRHEPRRREGPRRERLALVVPREDAPRLRTRRTSSRRR